MPLRDHFRPPLSERRPWESFHSTWASTIADLLNRDVLEAPFIALEQVHRGAALEIDVATVEEQSTLGGTATATRTVWRPAAAPIVIPVEYPPSCTVEVWSSEGGRTLVAAIELVSPGNKDRSAKRKQFAAKCATYLSRGVGLIVLDVVTTRQGNLHNDLIEMLDADRAALLSDANPYAAAYRPLNRPEGGQLECWPTTLVVGQDLPTLPLSLGADYCVPVDFEAAYGEACQRRRVDEVSG